MSLVIVYCRPFTCDLVALDVAPEHVETYRERRRTGGFCPRTLWAARPELFRAATAQEKAIAGYEPARDSWHVHQWEELTCSL